MITMLRCQVQFPVEELGGAALAAQGVSCLCTGTLQN